MSWRPWIATALLAGSVLVNVGLLYQERIDPPAEAADLKDEVKDILLLEYRPENRRQNFEAMGLDEELVGVTVKRTKSFSESAARLKALIDEDSEEVANALCPGGKLPARYAALGLVVEPASTGSLKVIEPRDIRRFVIQDWFLESLAEEVFAELELTRDRKPDATVMGVAALLLKKDAEALDGQSPWSRGFGGSWGLSALMKRYPEAKTLVVQYFAMMHLLTELARDADDGVCG